MVYRNCLIVNLYLPLSGAVEEEVKLILWRRSHAIFSSSILLSTTEGVNMDGYDMTTILSSLTTTTSPFFTEDPFAGQNSPGR